MKREFYLQDDRSNKFWTIEVSGNTVITTNGRVGAKPRETRKEFPSSSLAEGFAAREIASKRRKGYEEGAIASIPEYDKRLPPKLIRINHDDYDAAYVGKTKAGDQFFLTFPFTPGAQGSTTGGNFIALYVFDEFGALKDARIHRSKPTETEEREFREALLNELGDYRFCDIKVAPFSVEAFGMQFGLIFDPGEDDGDGEEDEDSVWVTVEPGNYMAFYPPWDGEYDT